MNDFRVVRFNERDVAQLLSLMRELAAYERYIDEFAVRAADLMERGLQEPPEFTALVAKTSEDEVLGMAVYYVIPFTYDLSPDMVLKELFVAEYARGRGVGEALMARLTQDAQCLGCNRIKWLVLNENERAKAFYARMGGRKDTKWENWILAVPKRVPFERLPEERVS